MLAKASQKNNEKVFITDCEGPISTNDNAFELIRRFVSKGDMFFALISKYDDVLADVVEKPGYKAGDTLRLILPFLRAYGATNHKIEEFSSNNVLLVPGAQDTLRFVAGLMPSFIVSTSYEQYISSLCHLTGFPYFKVYCTKLDIDKYEMSEEEANKLKKISEEISAMPMIEIPEHAKTVHDFSRRDRETIHRLNEVFWEDIPKMESGKMLEEVNPVGGYEKAKAVREIVEKLDNRLDNVMYVGDSITDVPPFKLVKEEGGLTVSFNGNSYAIREAEIAVLSGNTIVTSVLAEVFCRLGKVGVIGMIGEWTPSGLKRYNILSTLQKRMLKLYSDAFPKVEAITSETAERLRKQSGAFRRTVRGEAIGKLG
ncbi:MAG: HAD hydrolase family protein [Candidatus Bathyarchaeota archaeon]|nr:MAG: HAD hydrolase family protein [Candidatus Bathyarchaeota archaeon]